MVRTSIYMKSVLRYEFLIFETYHWDTLYLRQEGCDDPWLPFEAKIRRQAKEIWKYRSIYCFNALT